MLLPQHSIAVASSLCCRRADEIGKDNDGKEDVAEVSAVEEEDVKGVPTLSETTLGVARALPHIELVVKISEYPDRDGAIWW